MSSSGEKKEIEQMIYNILHTLKVEQYELLVSVAFMPTIIKSLESIAESLQSIANMKINDHENEQHYD